MSWYKKAKKQTFTDEQMISMFKKFWQGGLANSEGITISDVDQNELKMGVEVEKEHVEDETIATRIALDHFAEMDDYYTQLKKMEEGECDITKLISKFIEDTKDDWNYMTPEELNKKDLKDFYLLDTRREEDFSKGHIKGANNIFWLDLFKEENLEKLPKDKKIVVICYVGHTASQVMVLLKLLGYKAMALKFGMGISPAEGIPVAGWTDFGFEIVKD